MGGKCVLSLSPFLTPLRVKQQLGPLTDKLGMQHPQLPIMEQDLITISHTQKDPSVPSFTNNFSLYYI